MIKKLALTGFLICLAAVAQMGQTGSGYITEGVGVEGLIVGKATKDDIINKYGADFKVVKHLKYSLEIVYEKIGLSFYYCHEDPNKEIFVIEVEKPYQGRTSKGIVMGRSTRADVVRAYLGRRLAADESLVEMSEIEYEGVQFYFDQNGIVNGIDIIEKSGLRQCDELFGEAK